LLDLLPLHGRHGGLGLMALVKPNTTQVKTPTVPLSTQVYKWVPANLMLEVTLPWTGIPSRGE